MMRLIRGALIVGAAIGAVLITAAIGLTAKKSSPLETTNTTGSQKSENTPMRQLNRSGTQGVREVDKRKYKLLVRIESPTSDSQEGPRLTLTVRNESREPIYIVETGRPWDFEFEVKNNSGRTLPPRKDDQQLLREGGKQSLVTVNAGQEISYVIDLGGLYSLAGGEYLLTAKKVIYLNDKRTAEIKSAPVKFVFRSSK